MRHQQFPANVSVGHSMVCSVCQTARLKLTAICLCDACPGLDNVVKFLDKCTRRTKLALGYNTKSLPDVSARPSLRHPYVINVPPECTRSARRDADTSDI